MSRPVKKGRVKNVANSRTLECRPIKNLLTKACECGTERDRDYLTTTTKGCNLIVLEDPEIKNRRKAYDCM